MACPVAAAPALSPTDAAKEPAADARSALRQVAGILEYIAGDYRQAVAADGRLLLPSEYDEQRSLSEEAAALLGRAGILADDPLALRVDALRAALAGKQSPARVTALCRAARELIIERHGVTLQPSRVPSRDAAAQLYVTQGCVNCHGQDGSANTEAARALEPRPANFLDRARMAAVSPYRAFYAISAGVAGTGMKGFPELRDSDRWSLAFYVLGLRHAHADLARGEREFDHAKSGLPESAAGLALLTDEDILHKLEPLAPESRTRVLAYLRAQAPYENEHERSDLRSASGALRKGLDAYEKGDREGARAQFVAAYLEGFEPHEAAIGAHDRELVREIERAMLELRKAAAAGEPAQKLERRVEQTEALLLRAEDAQRSGTTALVGALTISVREGFEIALLIGALLALVRKRGLPELAKYVHAGWMLAAVAGLLTFYAVGAALSGFSREFAEGIATLVAAFVLLGVTHWLLGQLSARHFMGFVARQMNAAANRRTALGILGLSFLATYREAFEVVLFVKALLLDARDERGRVWLGIVLGLGALGLCSLVLRRIGQRLQPRPFMLVSSALLALLVFALTGNGIHALQMAGVVGIRELGLPELAWLGIYPTLESASAQACVLLFLLGSALWPALAQRRASQAQPAE